MDEDFICLPSAGSTLFAAPGCRAHSIFSIYLYQPHEKPMMNDVDTLGISGLLRTMDIGRDPRVLTYNPRRRKNRVQPTNKKI